MHQIPFPDGSTSKEVLDLKDLDSQAYQVNCHGPRIDEFGIDTPIDAIGAYRTRTTDNGNKGKDIKAFIDKGT